MYHLLVDAMWSFFSRDQLKSFPYEIGEKVSDDDDYSVWTLHVGKSKVSIKVNNGLYLIL